MATPCAICTAEALEFPRFERRLEGFAGFVEPDEVLFLDSEVFLSSAGGEGKCNTIFAGDWIGLRDGRCGGEARFNADQGNVVQDVQSKDTRIPDAAEGRRRI